MIKNIISAALLLFSVALSFKHAWDSVYYKDNPGSAKIMESLAISQTFMPYMAALAIVIGILLLIPNTFFLGNTLNAQLVVIIIGLALRAGDYRIALIEIPFVVMPLVLIWLKYPFK